MISGTTTAPVQSKSATEVDFSAPHYQDYVLVRGNDRCDRCGAEAFVATAHESGMVLWCGHHYREHEPALSADPRVKVVADETARLTVRETEVH